MPEKQKQKKKIPEKNKGLKEKESKNLEEITESKEVENASLLLESEFSVQPEVNIEPNEEQEPAEFSEAQVASESPREISPSPAEESFQSQPEMQEPARPLETSVASSIGTAIPNKTTPQSVYDAKPYNSPEYSPSWSEDSFRIRRETETPTQIGEALQRINLTDFDQLKDRRVGREEMMGEEYEVMEVNPEEPRERALPFQRDVSRDYKSLKKWKPIK